jgi:hypothetical protein
MCAQYERGFATLLSGSPDSHIAADRYLLRGVNAELGLVAEAQSRPETIERERDIFEKVYLNVGALAGGELTGEDFG